MPEKVSDLPGVYTVVHLPPPLRLSPSGGVLSSSADAWQLDREFAVLADTAVYGDGTAVWRATPAEWLVVAHAG
jgi:hypothetical protein